MNEKRRKKANPEKRWTQETLRLRLHFSDALSPYSAHAGFPPPPQLITHADVATLVLLCFIWPGCGNGQQCPALWCECTRLQPHVGALSAKSEWIIYIIYNYIYGVTGGASLGRLSDSRSKRHEVRTLSGGAQEKFVRVFWGVKNVLTHCCAQPNSCVFTHA